MSLGVLVWAMFVPVVLAVGAVALLGYVVVLAVSGRGTEKHGGADAARWVGLLFGAAVAGVLLALSLGQASLPGRLGLGALIGAAPLLGALVLVLAVQIGERSLSARAGDRRYGGLRPRTPSGLLPRIPSIVAGAAVVLLLALTVLTALAASPDDQGRPGRSLDVRLHTAADGTVEAALGPFPGSWYVIPVWITLAVLLLAVLVAVARVVRRRPSEDPADLLLRRRSLVSVLGATALGAGLVDLAFGALALRAYVSIDQTAASAGATVSSTPQVLLCVATTVVGVLASLSGLLMVLAPAVFAPTEPRRP